MKFIVLYTIICVHNHHQEDPRNVSHHIIPTFVHHLLDVYLVKVNIALVDLEFCPFHPIYLNLGTRFS